ncbi:MAG: oligosaccharide flippase family protein [Proteobacteria bacterium]|nr:oligosaccharide flippase family protein [Pseudomonadota bacterium]
MGFSAKLKRVVVARSSFRTSVLTLVAGAVSSQLITLLISPILARHYSVAAFGQWALFVAVSAPLGIVSAAKYDSAVMLPKEDSEARKIAFASLVHVAGFSLLAATILFIALNSHFTFSGTVRVWMILPISICAQGINLVFATLLNRSGAYSDISKSRVIQSTVTAVANLTGMIPASKGLIDGGLILICGTVLGQIAGSVTLVMGYGKKKFKLLIYRNRYDRNLVKKYFDFPLYSMPEAAIGAILSNFPIYAFSYFFGGAATGQYSFAQRCLMLPAAIVGTAISQVNFKKFSSLYAVGKFSRSVFLAALIRSASIALLPAIFFLLFGREIFITIFGDKWHQAGEMTVMLAIPVFILFVFSTISGAHVVLRIQHASLASAIVSLLSKFMVLFVFFRDGVIIILVLFFIVDVLVSLAMNIFTFARIDGATS